MRSRPAADRYGWRRQHLTSREVAELVGNRISGGRCPGSVISLWSNAAQLVLGPEPMILRIPGVPFTFPDLVGPLADSSLQVLMHRSSPCFRRSIRFKRGGDSEFHEPEG